MLKAHLPETESFASLPAIILSIDDNDNDLEFAGQLASRLMDHRVMVFSYSIPLEEKIKNSRGFANGFFKKILPEELPNGAECCVVLLSQSYYSNKIHRKVCETLSLIDEKGMYIMPIRIDNNIPKVVEFELYKKLIRAGRDQADTVVLQILHKLTHVLPDVNANYDIESLLRRSRSVTKLELVDSYEDPRSKARYKFFRDFDNIRMVTTHWLYLYPDSKLADTYDQFIKRVGKEKKVVWKERLIILVDKRYRLKKASLADKYGSVNELYIHDFVWTECTPDHFRQMTDDGFSEYIKFYVEPMLQDESGRLITARSLGDDWLGLEDKPILVIKGSGGIGKTTLARYMAHRFKDDRKNSTFIFVPSSDIIAELQNIQNRHEELDLYSFYEAWARNQQIREVLDKDLFRHNFDNGNFLLVLDGIDEVFSKLDFDIKKLLRSVSDYAQPESDGKVIITCREYFWQSDFDSELKQTLEVFELLPFDRPLALDFFRRKFDSSQRKVDRSIEVAEKSFSTSSSKNGPIQFLPFVLDIVSNIIDTDPGYIQKDPEFDSRILNAADNTDHIIFKICHREVAKIYSMHVDQQLWFFMRLAIRYGGSAHNQKVDGLLRDIKPDINPEGIKTFKAHPFLTESDDYFKFRYDFFEEYFKALYLSIHFDFYSEVKEELSEKIIDLIADDCKYHSGLVREIARRYRAASKIEDEKMLQSREEGFLYRLEEMRDTVINQFREGRIAYDKMQKFLSGLFFIALKIQHEFQQASNSKDINTMVLKGLFGETERNPSDGSTKEIIKLWCLHNFVGSDKILFDFRGLTFKECYINGYEGLLDCEFDEKTYFDVSCSLLNVVGPSSKSISATSANFHHRLSSDESLWKILKVKEVKPKDKRKAISESVKAFFKIFYQSGVFQDKPLDFIKKLYKQRVTIHLPFDDFVDIMLDCGLLARMTGELNSGLRVPRDSKIAVEKFILENNNQPVITKALRLLEEELK